MDTRAFSTSNHDPEGAKRFGLHQPHPRTPATRLGGEGVGHRTSMAEAGITALQERMKAAAATQDYALAADLQKQIAVLQDLQEKMQAAAAAQNYGLAAELQKQIAVLQAAEGAADQTAEAATDEAAQTSEAMATSSTAAGESTAEPMAEAVCAVTRCEEVCVLRQKYCVRHLCCRHRYQCTNGGPDIDTFRYGKKQFESGE